MSAVGRPGPVPLAALLSFCLLMAFCSFPAHASDDSNAGQLTPAPTVTAQQLNSALTSLAQGTNDTQLQQLLSQFQSEMGSGDYSAASSTLVQLQGLSSNTNGGASPALNALLQSLSVGSGGASVNSDTLSSLLQSAATSGESAQKLSVDMASLANLMQFANSTLASQLLQNSASLSQTAFAGSAGGPAGGGSIPLPGVSKIPGLSIPSIGGPSLSVAAPAGGLPHVPLADFVLPLVVAVAAAIVLLSRGRISSLVGSQRLPGVPVLRRSRERDEDAPVPSDPRSRVEFYFWRAVRLMAGRGVPKAEWETHREFSAKCEPTPERPHVATISSLYEKAKFSGQEVEGRDAELAATELLAMGREDE